MARTRPCSEEGERNPQILRHWYNSDVYRHTDVRHPNTSLIRHVYRRPSDGHSAVGAGRGTVHSDSFGDTDQEDSSPRSRFEQLITSDSDGFTRRKNRSDHENVSGGLTVWSGTGEGGGTLSSVTNRKSNVGRPVRSRRRGGVTVCVRFRSGRTREVRKEVVPQS